MSVASPPSKRKSGKASSSTKHRREREKDSKLPLTKLLKTLRNASHKGDLEEVRRILETHHEIDINAEVSRDRATALHHAAYTGEVEVLRYLLENRADVHRKDIRGCTPLQNAAYNGHHKCIKMLISHGADVNTRDKDGTTPLHKAAYCGNSLCVRYLLRAGAEINAKDADNATPLHHAAFHNHLDVIGQLIRRKANLNCADDEGSTPLHKAVFADHPAVVKALLEAGASIDKSDSEGSTPLHIAAFKNRLECARLLVENMSTTATSTPQAENSDSSSESNNTNSDNALIGSAAPSDRTMHINAKDKEGVTALHHAADKGFGEMAALLLSHRADPNAADQSGSTPLHMAAYKGHVDVARQLLDAGANVNAADNHEGATPLHHAAWCGHVAVAALLIERGARLDACDSEGATPLHKSAFNGHEECTRVLCNVGAKPAVDAKDGEGSTPLHKAAYSGAVATVKMLLDANADVKAVDKDDGTPLHNAAFAGNLDCVRLLVENGADPNAADEKGFTPLHLAARNGHTDVAKYLVEIAGTPLDVQDDKGMTPLHHAVAHVDVATYMLERGAEIDAKDFAGRTPLYAAMKGGHADTARVLILRGADPYCKDKKGQAPIDVDTLNKGVLLELVNQREEKVAAETSEHLAAAVRKFNVNPRLGIDYLVSKCVIKNTPEDIARFLMSALEPNGLSCFITTLASGTNQQAAANAPTPTVDRVKLGEFLGDSDAFALEVMKAFVDSQDFRGLEFDAALRNFLSKFRLPGEAQKIDRIMQRFAARYRATNPGLFRSEDTAYLLAFSTIMLNTDAHSPSVRDKMTKAQFVANNLHYINQNEEQLLPNNKAFLERLYDNIVNNEIKLSFETPRTPAGAGAGSANQVLMSDASKRGWLTKQGGRIKSWKRRYFVLSNHCLYYFKQAEDREPLGIIPLENLDVRRLTSSSRLSKKHMFEVYDPRQHAKSGHSSNGGIAGGQHGGDSDDDDSATLKACKLSSTGTLVKGHHQSYLISADSAEDADEWVAAIKGNIARNPAYELLQQRLLAAKQQQLAMRRSASLNSMIAASSASGSSTSLSSSASTPRFSTPESARHSSEFATSGLCESDLMGISIREIHALCEQCGAVVNSGKTERSLNTDPAMTLIAAPVTDAPNQASVTLGIAVSNADKTQRVFVHYFHPAWNDTAAMRAVFLNYKDPQFKSTEFDVHRQFLLKEAAKKAQDLVVRVLKKEFNTVIVGHSMSAAVALLLAWGLRLGGYALARIVTFGQPKVHTANGVEMVKSLPILRVSYYADPVPCLFPGYQTPGSELLLLKEGYYSYAPDMATDRPLKKSTLDDEAGLEEKFHFAHSLQGYLASLSSKLTRPMRVLPEEKERYC